MSLKKIRPIYFILPPLVLVLALISFILVLDWDTQSTLAQFLIYSLISLAIVAGLAVIIEIPLLFYFALKKPKSISPPNQSSLTKMKSLFGKIESKEQAVKIINHVSRIFVILGIIQMIGGSIFINFSHENRIAIGITGLIHISFGFLLKKFKSIIIVSILLLFTLSEIMVAILNLFGVFNQPKAIPIIAVAIAIATIRAMQAIFKIQSVKKSEK